MKTQVEINITDNATRNVSPLKRLLMQHKVGGILSAALEENSVGMGFELVNLACN